MWDSPRPSIPVFRGRPGEPYPPRWPHGLHPRIRGRPPFPFRGGARVPGPHFGSQGGVPFGHRDMGVIQAEEQMNLNLSRRGRPPINYRALGFREGEVLDMRYAEQNTPENEFRARLAPDMDYRMRDASVVDQRGMPDVDYRHDEKPAIVYRERLPPPSIFREREALEYRKRMAAEMELREREAIELEHRERLAAALDYRDREAADLEYKRRLDALLDLREREAALLDLREREAALLELREREATELLLRDRGPAEILLREREAAALALRERGAVALALRERDVMEFELRERAAMDYRERGVPPHFRESADRDLRVRDSEALRFKESGMEVDFRERERGLDYRERMARDSGNNALQYREKETANMDYMEVEYKNREKLNIDKSTKETTDQESTGMSYRQGEASHTQYKKGETQIPSVNFQRNTDTDYRDKESADSDYREKDSADAGYRENADLDYRNMEAVDSDYREKKRADSDYRERESADADYRKSADNSVKQSTDTTMTQSEDSSSTQKTKKTLADYRKLPIPDPASKEPLSVFDDFREGNSIPNTDKGIPFLSSEDPRITTLSNIKNEALHPDTSQSTVTTKGGLQSKSSCPGKLDIDLRDRLKPEDIKHGAREMADKAAGCTDTPRKELGPSDQDMRRNKNFGKDSNRGGGDQDFRTGAYMQKKDEDLRSGKDSAPVNLLSQNSLLFDFLQLAAKELKQREKGAVRAETEGQAVSRTPEEPPSDSARMSLPPAQNTVPVKSSGLGSSSSGIEFIGRQDTDYRNMDFNDVDLRVGYSQDKRSLDKKSRDDLQPGSKDKDYRRASLPDGATRIIWLDGLPTGASREDILYTLGSARKLPETGVNLIGYIPGYSFGSVCVEFSLVEEAVGCMEANKGTLTFRGKKINLKYIPNSDRWNCQQCKIVNVLSKERCWQCSALRAGSDHLPLRDSHKDLKTPSSLLPQRGKKRKARQSPSARSPDRWKEKTPPRERSPPSRTIKGTKQAESESATVIIRGIGINTSPQAVVKALDPYVRLTMSNVRIMKNRKSDHRGFGFIDLKNHKEAIRLTVLVRGLKPPLTIDGKPITVDLAVGQRKNDPGKFQKGNKMSPGKGRKQRGQRRNFPGSRGNAGTEGPSYVFDPKTGQYVDPLTETFYDDAKTQRKKDESPHPSSERKESVSQTRRGFTEDKEPEQDEDPFKRPLPPQVIKKEEPPPEPQLNPLIKLIGEYGDDSEEEDEPEEQLLLPPLRKKPPPPPPPVPAPKPVPKPAPPISGLGAEDKLTDWKKMACLLCRRQFSSKDTLIRHQTLSDLHKQNIAIHEKIRKSQKELAYLQQKEREENQSIQRRLQLAKKELEMLEREEQGVQQETGDSLGTGVRRPEREKPDTSSELRSPAEVTAGLRHPGESYRENMKRLILSRYKDLE